MKCLSKEAALRVRGEEGRGDTKIGQDLLMLQYEPSPQLKIDPQMPEVAIINSVGKDVTEKMIE